MGDKRKTIKAGISDFFDIPKDIFLDLPRIIMIGSLQVYIENHRGIIEYQQNFIRININKGEIEVKGKNLVLKSMFSEDIFIEGEIDSIHYNS